MRRKRLELWSPEHNVHNRKDAHILPQRRFRPRKLQKVLIAAMTLHQQTVWLQHFVLRPRARFLLLSTYQRPHNLATNSATNSDPNKLSDQTRTTSDQRNTSRQSRGAIEPRSDGDTSWRERDRYHPHEKTVRKRTISELKAPSSNKQRSDVSHEATPRRDTGERPENEYNVLVFKLEVTTTNVTVIGTRNITRRKSSRRTMERSPNLL